MTTKQLPAQKIAWDPSLFLCYSDEQIALIKKGFDIALDLAYQAEQNETKMPTKQRTDARALLRELGEE